MNILQHITGVLIGLTSTVSNAQDPLISSNAENAKFFEFDMTDNVAMTVQDRAYTSPIWYTPGKWQAGIPPISLVAVIAALLPLLVKRRLVHDMRQREQERQRRIQP